jgi:hypothetical protein
MPDRNHEEMPAMIVRLLTAITTLSTARTIGPVAVRLRVSAAGDDGFSTAELLGNAALGIAALVVIWGGMQALGTDVTAWIRGQLIGG